MLVVLFIDATASLTIESENVSPNSSVSVLNGPLIHDVQVGKHTAANVTLIDREAMVELLQSREVNVTACLIPDGVPDGLLVDDCEDLLVSSCEIIDRLESSMMETGVD